MAFPWHDVNWVLLDMDGTLLDKHFDDYFWETLVPQEFARQQGLALAAARQEVFARYQREEGTLNWTDIDFWSRELDLDIPALKEGIRHLIEVHTDTEAFLQYVRRLEKHVALVTNAHWKTLWAHIAACPSLLITSWPYQVLETISRKLDCCTMAAP